MNKISTGHASYRPTAHLLSQFANIDLAIPVSALMQVEGNILSASLVGKYSLERPETMSLLVERAISFIASMNVLAPPKGKDENPEDQISALDNLLTQEVFRKDSLIGSYLAVLAKANIKQEQVFADIATHFRKRVISDGVSLSDLFNKTSLDDEDTVKAIKENADDLSLKDIANVYASAVDFHGKLLNARPALESQNVISDLQNNPAYLLARRLTRLRSGVSVQNIPVTLVSISLGLDTMFERKRLIGWNLESVDVADNKTFDMRDVYQAVVALESMILNQDINKNLIEGDSALDAVILDEMRRMLLTKSGLESTSIVPDGANIERATSLILYLFKHFLLLRVGKDVVDHFHTIITTTEAWRDASRSSFKDGLVEGTRLMDQIMSSMLDTYSYLSEFVAGDTSKYLNDRENKSVLNPAHMHAYATLFQARRSSIQENTIAPSSTSSLYWRSLQRGLNHRYLPFGSEGQDLRHHIPSPPQGANLRPIIINGSQNGVSVAGMSMVKNDIRTIKGATVEMTIIMPDLVHIVLFNMADDRSTRPILYSIQPLVEIGKLGQAAHYVNVSQVTNRSLKALGLNAEQADVVSDLFLKGDDFAVDFIEPGMSLEEKFLLPSSVFEVMEWLKVKGGSVKQVASKLNANEDFIRAVMELFQDYYVLVRTPGRVVLHLKEVMFELAFRVPSVTTHNQLWVAYGHYPILQSGIEKRMSVPMEAMVSDALKLYGQDENAVKLVEDFVKRRDDAKKKEEEENQDDVEDKQSKFKKKKDDGEGDDPDEE